MSNKQINALNIQLLYLDNSGLQVSAVLCVEDVPISAHNAVIIFKQVCSRCRKWTDK